MAKAWGRNTRYFHQKSLIRRRKNKVEALLNEDDDWVYKDHSILNALVSQFKSLFYLYFSFAVQLADYFFLCSYFG